MKKTPKKKEPMPVNHFEVLLEEMRSNFQLAFEGIDGINSHLAEHDRRFDQFDMRFDRIEADVGVLKTDVRDIKRGMGVLQSIASDHEDRIQVTENSLQDHLAQPSHQK